MQLIARLLINAAALWLATQLIDGISFDGDWRLLFVVAIVFGLLNAIVRPVLKLLTFPFIIVTLGLFIFVLNAFMLWLTSAISDRLGLGFHVAGFKRAFVGALFISVVSFFMSLLVGKEEKEKRRKLNRRSE